MPVSARVCAYCLLGVLACGVTGCTVMPASVARQNQYRTMQMSNQNRALASEMNGLRSRTAALQNQLQVANSRLGNLSSERGELQKRYLNVLARLRNQPSPLSAETTRRLQELMKKYPSFDFDPESGVSKFHSDILFASGSSSLRQEAVPLLREFAEIMNDSSARDLNILVVGHTDDRPIAKEKTRSNHPTNWHLSGHRAISVVSELGKFGINENRMGAAGYSMYQPAVPNTDDASRAYNRRVEIYVLAPDAAIAQRWDPGRSRN